MEPQRELVELVGGQRSRDINVSSIRQLIWPLVEYTIKTDSGVDGRPLDVDASTDRDLLQLVLFDKDSARSSKRRDFDCQKDIPPLL